MVLKRSLWISMCFLLSIHQSFSLPNHFGIMLIDMEHLHTGDIILSDNWNYTLSANGYGSFTTFISIKNHVQISSINVQISLSCTIQPLSANDVKCSLLYSIDMGRQFY